MKRSFLFLATTLAFLSCKQGTQSATAQSAPTDSAVNKLSQPEPESYYIDVHDMTPGKITVADVAAAHQKDLATEGKFGVDFIKYWVDPAKGKIYCLSKAPNEESIINTHREAHGLLPSHVYKVTDGPEAAMEGNEQLYLDVHHVTPGSVTAKDVAAAHQKDLAVEKKYGVNFIDYWVDPKAGVIMCLSQAPDSEAIKKTHKEAHGLLPSYVLKVSQGQ
ncbi:MAG: DUF4242 domain-containing protein [Ginsengibacter sp.]